VKGDEIYLRHILDAIEKIESYSSVGYNTFASHSHWQDAVIRQLEIVGEATKRLSQDLRSQNHEVPWRRIAGLRDVLIHNYMGVDLDAVWEITRKDLPVLKKQVQVILRNFSSNERPPPFYNHSPLQRHSPPDLLLQFSPRPDLPASGNYPGRQRLYR
jgi:uncharacterized protein with HEPN domain